MTTLTRSEWAEIYEQLAHLTVANKLEERKGFVDALTLILGKEGADKIEQVVNQYIHEEVA